MVATFGGALRGGGRRTLPLLPRAPKKASCATAGQGPDFRILVLMRSDEISDMKTP